MPVFNRVKHLRTAVSSVYSQTFDNWELIIVDDGSEQDTRQFLRTPTDSRMIVSFHPHTGIPALVRNRGIRRARGRYIAFLDSDDLWAPDKLERQLALMNSAPTRRWSYTAVRRIDTEGRVMDGPRSVPWVPYDGSIVEKLLRIDAQIATPTVMADLALVRELGGFDEKIQFIEDYDLWSRLAMHSEVSVEHRQLSDVRSHHEQFTLDRIGKLGGWVQYYTKMEELVSTQHLRVLCRRLRGENLLLLASQQARTRDWAGMRGSLFAAAGTRALSVRGWLSVAKSAALSSRREVHDR